MNTGARICGAQAAAFLDARLAIWQGRLNLANWKISLQVSHARDLKPKTMGNIHWDSQKRTATIRVLDPADYQLACRDALSDMQATVIPATFIRSSQPNQNFHFGAQVVSVHLIAYAAVQSKFISPLLEFQSLQDASKTAILPLPCTETRQQLLSG